MNVRFQGVYYIEGPKHQVIKRVAQLQRDNVAIGAIGGVQEQRRNARGVVLTRHDFVNHLIEDYGLKPRIGGDTGTSRLFGLLYRVAPGLKPRQGADTDSPEFLATLNTQPTFDHMVRYNTTLEMSGVAAKLERGEAPRTPEEMITQRLFDYYERRKTQKKGLDANNQAMQYENLSPPRREGGLWARLERLAARQA